ncbi:hypothetical protein [uncultured Pseudoteredinibacter sp.]|uniref:hypothetical protein n=1 Tax=uncultured Pseudoteredinibacter sp. TaxID=1641701 RepID=UPI0026080809|nr:hypothetical protein [uncultured Pseudoteredinibacter sp.]
MKLNEKTVTVAVIVAVLISAYVVVNTRLGAYLIIDVIGSSGDSDLTIPSAESGPLRVSRQLEPLAEIAMPKKIEQPSGIQHRGDRIYISTDQAELFILDDKFKIINDSASLVGGPLLFKQGSLEGIEVVDNSVLAIGEFGSIRKWSGSGENWQRQEDIALPANIQDFEFSGISITKDRQLATSEETPELVDVKKGEIHKINFGSFMKPGGDISSLSISGLAYENGKYYVLTENYTSILVLDANSLEVIEVLGIIPTQAADLSVRNGRAYIVVDHNYVDELPPVYVYQVDTI